MVTGYNKCPICRKKYSARNESKLKVDGESVCMGCFRKKKNHSDYGSTISGNGLIHYFDDNDNFERTKIGGS